MSNRINRRTWLAQTLFASTAAFAARPVGAIEPIERSGGSQFKFSLAAYSYRDLLTGDQPKLTLSEFILDCAAMGLDGTELTSYYFPDPVTPEYLRQLKRECFRLGLDISGTAVGNDFGHSEDEKRDRAIAQVKQWVDYAELLGAPVIRVFAGHIPEGSDPSEAHRRIVTALEQCCEYAGQHGVHLALENHGGPTATVDGLLALVRDVQSPWFGVNLDTGNFHTDDVYGDLEKAAPYALNVQVKVVISDSSGNRQPTDFGRLASMLRACNYRGYIVLEYEESGDPRTDCPRYIQELKAAFA